MLYQKLLPASTPYVVHLSSNSGSFPLHKHYEIELIYAQQGSSIKLNVGDKELTASNNELAVIGSLIPHSTDSLGKTVEILVLELGPVFLKKHFHTLADLDLSNPLIDLNKDDDVTRDLKCCLDEIYTLYKDKTRSEELLIISNIYRICADIIKLKSDINGCKMKKSYKKLERVLDHIHVNYSGKISLEETAALAGYSKGNFCKAFKETTGMSFHAYLNNYRVTNACYLLTDTDIAIGDIGSAVGFSEFKTFSRVFKAVTGQTPTEFRNSK